MTFRLQHEWSEGATLPTGIALATCEHCATLRATELHRDASVIFIRRREEEAERVVSVEPPCISAAAFFRAPW